MTDAAETRGQLDVSLADLSTAIGVLGSLEGIVDNLKTNITVLATNVGPGSLDRAHIIAQTLSRTQMELATIRTRFTRLSEGIREWQQVL